MRTWSRRIVRGLLILSGLVTLCALPAVFMPRAWMEDTHRQLGLGSFPEGPMTEYLARSLSLFYAAFGMLTLTLASDLERYFLLVRGWGLFAMAFGATIWWISHQVGMPAVWTWGEGPLLIPAGFIVLVCTLRKSPR